MLDSNGHVHHTHYRFPSATERKKHLDFLLLFGMGIVSTKYLVSIGKLSFWLTNKHFGQS